MKRNKFILINISIIVSLSGFFINCRDISPEPGSLESISEGKIVKGPWEFGQKLPGALPSTQELVEKLSTAWKTLPEDYIPRTRHKNPDGSPKYSNRLLLETSPYLRQHAHNPVNWFPWGDEAFDLAKKLNRPVLLSIGYSTCHWCHVMEEESFEDEEIAKYLNENYIAIKVDREERPDLDSFYMSAVQLIAKRGGWPMTTWLTPDRKPFYGGTYFPPRDGDRGSRVGFLTLLQKFKESYDSQPEEIAKNATQISEAVQQRLQPKKSGTQLPDDTALQKAFQIYQSRFDSTYGSLNRAPKFPSHLPIRFLLRYARRAENQEALQMAALTLEKMAAGGMYDQVAGGFHRYSTDKRWLVPHFEKMLYDNALLTLAYLEGYQATKREDFAKISQEILHYVSRDMTSPEGAFYSATDADSINPKGHREEGWFFTWTPEEIQQTLPEKQAQLVLAYYGLSQKGNFEGRNILFREKPLDEISLSLDINETKAQSLLQEAKETLYQKRLTRPKPLRDEKILTAWNGLMISAYARAALVFNDKSYAKQAEAAASFVLTNLRKEGRLFRSYKDGKALHMAYLDDYAFLIAGLLDLYEATGNIRWFIESVSLDKVLEEFYEDKEQGGYFLTSRDHEKLLVREKPGYDGAEPSGNSVQSMNLLRLYDFTSKEPYQERAKNTLRAFSTTLQNSPTTLSEMLLSLDYFLDSSKEIVLVSPGTREEAEPMLKELRSVFFPNRVLVIVSNENNQDTQEKFVPLTKGKIAQKDKLTAYVCEEGNCKLPTIDPEVFALQIQNF